MVEDRQEKSYFAVCLEGEGKVPMLNSLLNREISEHGCSGKETNPIGFDGSKYSNILGWENSLPN